MKGNVNIVMQPCSMHYPIISVSRGYMRFPPFCIENLKVLYALYYHSKETFRADVIKKPHKHFQFEKEIAFIN